MNEKGTNFCSFSVGLEPATPGYEAVTQSIPPPRCAENLRAFFISFIILVYVPNCENRYKDHMRRCKSTLNPRELSINRNNKPNFQTMNSFFSSLSHYVSNIIIMKM